MKRLASDQEPGRAEQTAMLGVLGVLMVLIPALMLIAHVTEYTAIVISPPRYTSDPAAEQDHTIRCGRPLDLHVAIAHEGFFVRAEGEPWRRVGRSAIGYDHAALEDEVRRFKERYPHEVTATVSAEGEVPYATLVATLDTLRGRDCRLRDAWSGEEVPSQCLMWHPIIESGTPNRHVPKFRRGEVWPPLAPRELAPAG